ncbi:OB-fold domain-containing protein [Paraburkholderia dipogonis]|uniref:OB-fold domain-containing protein n=1 Tax=Paraburkholderia dipogonis TaxID=1211383 RepID=A0ABW9B5Q6_9BURK
MELLTRTENWNITYRHALGETASWFYVQLREHGKLYGRRCPQSGRVLVPPRAFSDQTLEPTSEWVEVGPRGVIETFTIVYEAFNHLPDPPYAFGYVLLENADTAIGGYFKGVDLSDPQKAAARLAVGTPVITRFAQERKGDMADMWFEVDTDR